MSEDYKKMFTTAENFSLLRDKLGDYKRLPTEKEMREFIDFLDDAVKIWKKMDTTVDFKRIEEKAKARRELVMKMGIKH